MIEYITDFHQYVKANPKQFGKKIHDQIKIIERLLKDKTLKLEYRENPVNAFVDYTKNISHIKGRQFSGKKIKLDPEQLWICACVLGIKYYSQEHNMWLRFFRELRISTGRDWGKTLFASVLASWLARFDKEPSAEVFCFAKNIKQAQQTYRNIKLFVERTKILSKEFEEIREQNYHVLYNKKTNSRITYGSSRPTDGEAPSVFLIDEGHEITNFEVYDKMSSGTGKRLQPLGIIFGTAGITKNSLHSHLYNQNEQILADYEIAKKSKVFIACFELDILDDYNNRELWCKPNPAMKYGRPSLEHLEEQYTKAIIGENNSSLTTFIAKNLNRQMDEASTFYDTNIVKQSLCKFDIDRIRGQYAYGGTDLSSYANFACNTCLIPVKHIDEIDLYDFYVIQQYYKAENRLEQDSQADKMVYKNFINTGSENPLAANLLYLCNGDANKPSDIAEWYRMLRDDYGIMFRRIGYDPEYYPAPFVEEMQNRGFPHEIVDFSENPPRYLGGILSKVKSKGGKLSDIIKLSKILFENKRIKIEETNKLLLYCLSNVKVSIDNLGKFTITKKGCKGQNDGSLSLLYALRVADADRLGFEEIIRYDPTRNRYQ